MARWMWKIGAIGAAAALLTGCEALENLLGLNEGEQIPIANAGEDQEVVLNTVVELDGSASEDPDDEPLSFEWTFDSVPAGIEEPSFDNPDNTTASFTPLALGSYVVRLTVSDDDGSAADTVEVTVVEQLSETEPQVPTGFSVTSSNEEVTATWDTLDGLTYNLYASDESGVDTSSPAFEDVVSPFVYEPTTFGVTYYYALEAVNDVGPSDLTEERSVLYERLPAPANPSFSSAGGPPTGSLTAMDSNGTYLVVADEAGFVHVSSDGGGSWQRLGDRLPATVDHLLIDSNDMVFAIYRPNASPTYVRRLSASSPGGTWISQDQIGPSGSSINTDADLFEDASETYLLVTLREGPDDSLYLYNAGSRSSLNVSPSTETSGVGGQAVVATNNAELGHSSQDDYVYVALSDGTNNAQFYYTSRAILLSGNVTWTEFETGLAADVVGNSAVELQFVNYFQYERLFFGHEADSNGRTLSVIDFETSPGDFTSETFESADSGELPTNTRVATMLSDGTYLTVVYENGEVYRAQVAGSSGGNPPYTWTQVHTLPDADAGSNLSRVMVEHSNDNYWIAGSRGLLYSPLFPDTPISLYDNGPSTGALIYLDYSGDTIFAGTRSGLFSLEGSTWSRIGGGLPDRRVFGYGKLDNRIYLSTENGLYSAQAGDTTWTTELSGADGAYAEVITRLGDRLVLDGDRHIAFYDPATGTYDDTGEYGVLATSGFTDGEDVYSASSEGDGVWKYDVSADTTSVVSSIGSNLIDMVFLDGFIYAMVAAEGGTYQVLRKDTGTTPFASFTTGAPADVSAAGLYTDGSAVYAAYVNGEVYRVNPSSGNMALYENLASGGISPLFMSNDYGRSVFPPGIPMLLRRGVFYVGSAVGPVFSAD